MNTPEPAKSLLENFRPAFTEPSFNRAVFYVLAAIVTIGSKTVCNVLRTVGVLSFGHASSFHRLFSHRRWRAWTLSRILTTLIVDTLCPEGVIRVTGDDTVDGHKGKNVFGKGCHRDAVRSTHSHTVYRWGHRWVVLSVLVQLSMTKRYWALPIMVALYRPKKLNDREGRHHKTPSDLMRQLLVQILRWFPGRKFIFCGDQGFAKHEIATLGKQSGGRMTIISRFYPNANLYQPPSSGRRGAGRPRIKGTKLPSPEDVVAATPKRKRLRVRWYGGGERDVGVVSGVGHWYKAGQGLVPIRWVYVEDRTGTHREEYFYTTDVAMPPQELIEGYTSRWSLEVTFEEMRAYLGLESTRGWTKTRSCLRLKRYAYRLKGIRLCWTYGTHDGASIAGTAGSPMRLFLYSRSMRLKPDLTESEKTTIVDSHILGL